MGGILAHRPRRAHRRHGTGALWPRRCAAATRP